MVEREAGVGGGRGCSAVRLNLRPQLGRLPAAVFFFSAPAAPDFSLTHSLDSLTHSLTYYTTTILLYLSFLQLLSLKASGDVECAREVEAAGGSGVAQGGGGGRRRASE